MPGPPYSTDHAGVELHQRAALTSQTRLQIIVLLLRLDLSLRNGSPTLIHGAYSLVSRVIASQPWRTQKVEKKGHLKLDTFISILQ